MGSSSEFRIHDVDKWVTHFRIDTSPYRELFVVRVMSLVTFIVLKRLGMSIIGHRRLRTGKSRRQKPVRILLLKVSNHLYGCVVVNIWSITSLGSQRSSFNHPEALSTRLILSRSISASLLSDPRHWLSCPPGTQWLEWAIIWVRLQTRNVMCCDGDCCTSMDRFIVDKENLLPTRRWRGLHESTETRKTSQMDKWRWHDVNE